MKAIMVMFDSLNRHKLPPYGCEWVRAPNFERLAGRCATFDNAYVGSMPCMPARRELHTGRYNFLHRSWGPLEPFDDSMPRILREHGTYTHLVSDHYHYWETGGCTYHTSYSSWEAVRGQEGDSWKGRVADPEMPPSLMNISQAKWRDEMWRQDWVNREYMQREEEMPQARTFALGLDFIETNCGEDNWFLQIETFDPHEPFYTQQAYQDLYPHDYDGPHWDWPPYHVVEQGRQAIAHMQVQYAALVSMCDHYLGQVMDKMDEHDLWADTMLIVCTDHGFLLGEHGVWGKGLWPWYNELSHAPLFIWDPRSRCTGVRRQGLVQTIDLAPTLLDFFRAPIPADMQGVPLTATVARDIPVRRAGLFGQWGAHVNCTDGRYVYMRAPTRTDNQPLHNYTVMPTHMRRMFDVDELCRAELAEPFSFTKMCPTLKIPAVNRGDVRPYETLLFDLESDPRQQHPLLDATVEAMMIDHLVRLMRENDAPPEQFERLGLPARHLS
jgi:arylsulfatase A-like enzyme